VRERPILFSAEMVRAILERGKTQTRRIVKPQPSSYATVTDTGISHVPHTAASISRDFRCPYGVPGDRLWVKEGARVVNATTGEHAWWSVEYVAGGSISGTGAMPGPWFPSTSRRADGSPRFASPIHLPRWASRITLEVVLSDRVERVQEITEEDAIDEGAERNTVEPGRWEPDWGYRRRCRHYPDGCECFPHNTAREWFAELWDSINGPGSWASNPWVRVIEFRRVGGEA
jgi:hypothetical protein